MKKDSFLKMFPVEVEKEAQKLYNTYEIASLNDIIVTTNEFYTPIFWKKIGNKIKNIDIYCDGAFEDSDRKKILFIPNNIGMDYKHESFIKLYEYDIMKIKINSKFHIYEHKDILGSLMGLNIKRELVGDIVLKDNEAYFPVSKQISDHIISELKQIGRDFCEALKITDKVANGEIKIPKHNFDEKLIVVPSTRLDSVVSAISNISRTKIIDLIEKGNVLLDYVVEKNKSKNVDIGTTITIRGIGKFKLFSNNGETKKGKEKILIKKYI